MDETDQPQEEGEFGLVMPFVVCVSNGGTLDDKAFVIGMELGEIAAQLQACAAMSYHAAPGGRWVHSEGLPQLDLIAMHHGFKFTGEPWEDDPAWTAVEFIWDGD